MSKGYSFACSKCGTQYPRWTGRCTECGSWSTVTEESDSATTESRPMSTQRGKPTETQAFTALSNQTDTPRTPLSFEPIDRVLSGGVVSGSVTLLSGEPGIGKSTLIAQAAIAYAATGATVLYVTGEESPSQVSLRLKRLRTDIPATLHYADATDVHVVAATIRAKKPALTIVDSIQSMIDPESGGSMGSTNQTKVCAGILTEAAKQSNAPLILIGQVNKDGDIAGPRLLEHLVDSVLMLEGDADHRFRILRALKHRFGSTEDVSVLTMTENGLEELTDPSAELIRDRSRNTSGSIISCVTQGHRPLLVEVQALVTPAGYGTPIRRTTGIDSSRLNLLLAVLSKRANVKVLEKDVYANIAGGISIREPSIDLGLCLAIASAISEVPVDPSIAAFGEIGLGGEIRPVSFDSLRIRECERHGFKRIILPKGTNEKGFSGDIRGISTVREAIHACLGST